MAGDLDEAEEQYCTALRRHLTNIDQIIELHSKKAKTHDYAHIHKHASARAHTRSHTHARTHTHALRQARRHSLTLALAHSH